MKKLLIATLTVLFIILVSTASYFAFYAYQTNKNIEEIQKSQTSPLLVSFDSEFHDNTRGAVVTNNFFETSIWSEGNLVDINTTNTPIFCLNKSDRTMWIEISNLLTNDRELYKFPSLKENEFKSQLSVVESQIIYSRAKEGSNANDIIFVIGCKK